MLKLLLATLMLCDPGLCLNISEVNPRSLSEIREIIESHDWETKSADKSPLGVISRFACTRCGDEYVAMVTTSRTVDEYSTNLEVSAGKVILN